MKIGIITYWQSDDNYGQQLQCWALQSYLSQQGHEPFLIRFKRYPWKPQQPTQPSFLTRLKGFIKALVKRLLVYPYIKECKRRKIAQAAAEAHRLQEEYIQGRNKEREFAAFRTENLSLSEKEYDTLEQLRQDYPKADAYVTGSDQVWNYDLQPEELAAFFLQFGNNSTKRIAYAPSIGHTQWPENLKALLRQYLSTFDAISVREVSAQSICKEVGIEAIHVLDPTLLLSPAEYKSITSNDCSEQPFIFIYSLNYSSSEDIPWKEIKTFAEQEGCAIKVTPSSGYAPCREIFDDVDYEYATIPEWLHNIATARLVITASFHGIALSILLHRPFIFTPLKGSLAVSNTRAQGLIDCCGLESQVWTDGASINEYANNNIDWKAVDEKLSRMRLRSEQFLSNSLQ